MRVINAVSLCENGFRFVVGADRSNVRVRKPSVPMVKAVVVPSLSSRVGVVFGFGSNAEMGGIDARRVVANVHNHFIIGDRPNVELVRIPMSANRFFAGKKKDAVTVTVAVPFPFPTTVSFVKAALKHIVWAKHRVLAKAIGFTRRHVALAAKFSPNNFRVPTFHATQNGIGSVSHRSPPMRRFYAITEV